MRNQVSKEHRTYYGFLHLWMEGCHFNVSVFEMANRDPIYFDN